MRFWLFRFINVNPTSGPNNLRLRAVALHRWRANWNRRLTRGWRAPLAATSQWESATVNLNQRVGQSDSAAGGLMFNRMNYSATFMRPMKNSIRTPPCCTTLLERKRINEQINEWMNSSNNITVGWLGDPDVAYRHCSWLRLGMYRVLFF